MSNEIALFTEAGLPTNVSALAESISKFKQKTQSGNVQYLKIGQHGKPTEGLITYGVDAVEVEPDSQWGVHIAGVQWGYLLRDGAEVVSEAWTSWYSDLPEVDQRQATGSREWKQSVKAQMVCVSGDDAGVVVEFGGDSWGHNKFYRLLMDALSERLSGELENSEEIIPLINLVGSSYYSKKRGEPIYEITPKILEWVSAKTVTEAVQAARTDNDVAA